MVFFFYISIYGSSHRRCSVEKGVYKNFVNFTGKHLCWSLFLIKLQATTASEFIGDTTLLHETILKKHTKGKTNFQDGTECNQKQHFDW